MKTKKRDGRMRAIRTPAVTIAPFEKGSVPILALASTVIRTFWFADADAANAAVVEEVWIETTNIVSNGGVPGELLQPPTFVFNDPIEMMLDLRSFGIRPGQSVRVVVLNIGREPLKVVLQALVDTQLYAVKRMDP